MENVIIEKLRELKESYELVVKKINEIEEVSSTLGSTNLKLHHVSYYLYQAVQDGIITDEQSLSTFEDICNFEYEYFQEWEKENLDYVKRDYIGRTSSFFYQSDWYGDVIDNGMVQTILEGENVSDTDYFGSLDNRIYEYLVNGTSVIAEILEMYDINDYDDDDEMIEDISDFFESEEEILTLLLDDLDYVSKIVNEAKEAYDFLDSYKSIENECTIAMEYLEHDISEYYAEKKAEYFFDRILNSVDKLNLVQSLKVSYTENENAKFYDLHVSVNDNEFIIDTEISSQHELSELCIKTTVSILDEKINEKFALS